MIPKMLLAAVTAMLALEGFSLLTAPSAVLKEALVRVRNGERRLPSGE